jgi:hypothetical protein
MKGSKKFNFESATTLTGEDWNNIAVRINFRFIVGGWPPWIYNRNKKKLIKCHIMNIPTMGMEFFLF